MRRVIRIICLVTICLMVVLAQPQQTTNLTTDVLGAHNVYGRGCVACHAPHSGPAGNNADATGGVNVALWGQNLNPLFGQTIKLGDNGSFSVTLPANAAAVTSAHDPTTIILMCLSCHDGNIAKPGMMKGATVETLPVVGGNAPTFLGNDGSGAGNYNNDHPVGPSATVGCGGQYNWDCSIDATGKLSMNGVGSAQFVKNYGFTVSLSAINNLPTVTCTSCHDQHSQSIYAGTIAGTKGYFATSFFVKGYYNPGLAGGNSAAQFCRNCHGGEANEMHGQMNVPTI
jgi:hypothetical protein